MQLPIMFGERVHTAARKHAEKEFPRESVGIVARGKYIRLTNIHPDPENHFRIDIDEINRLAGYDEVDALIHSHNTEVHPAGPSEADMKSQIAMGIPFGIQLVNSNGAGNIVWWGPDVPRLPYEGRPYIFGVLDCYAIVRDYFALEHNILLRDYARSDYYWEAEKPVDLYVNHIRDEGFEPVPLEGMQPGDLVLVKIRAPIVNHSIIYMGGDSGLHHPTGTLSRIDSISRYIDVERDFFHSVWRHKDITT